jgi:cation diffusion facilitator family transporter
MHAPTPHADPAALREKQSAALTSVAAALALTGLKLAAGLYTGSLGVLSEAAHSALDLVAAGLTLYAVRLSSRPPDRKHPYGHGKVENLSALAETLLLLATCAWIVFEAVERLLHPRPVEAPLWAAGVMLASMAVDIGRSRVLAHAAKKHNSQALEADALHFATDVWSSLVVLAGLGAIALAGGAAADSPLRALLLRADAVAALAVSGIVLSVSLRLGRQAVDVLLDARVEEDCAAVERAAAGVAGVVGVLRARVRRAGPASFVDLLLSIRAGLDADQAHGIADLARQAVEQTLPGAEVLVELRPEDASPRRLLGRVQEVAALSGLGVHDLQLRQEADGLTLDLHAEVPGALSLAEAHARVSSLEENIRRALDVARVTSHIEPVDGHPDLPEDAGQTDALRRSIEQVVRETTGVCGLHNLVLHRAGDRLAAAFHCRMPPETPITGAHDAATRIEAALRARLPELSRVTIHMEPEQTDPADLDSRTAAR